MANAAADMVARGLATSFPNIPTSSKGSTATPRVSSSTKAPAIPSITPPKVTVGLPKPPSTTLTKPLAVKPVKVKTKLSAVPSQDALRSVIGTMPAAVSNPYEMANQIVSANLNPLIQQITQGYSQQAGAGTNAIEQVTAEYAKQLAGIEPQVAGVYNNAEQGTAASNAALANIVSGAGNADANNLAAQLASINQPGAVNPAVQTLQNQAQGSAGAVYGTGNASLDALIGAGAAQEAYARELPSSAAGAGIQELAQYLGALEGAESTDIGDLTKSAPTLEQSAANTLIGQNEKQAAINAANARTRETVAGEAARTKATIAGEAARTKATTTAAAARTAATTEAAQDRTDATIQAADRRTNEEIVARAKIAAQTAATQRTKDLIATTLATNIDPNTGLLTPTGILALKKLGVTATPGSVAGTAGASVIGHDITAADAAQRLQATIAHDRVLAQQGQEKINLAAQKQQTAANQGWARIVVAQEQARTAKGRLAVQQAELALKKAGKTTGGLTKQEIGKLLQGWSNGTIKSIRMQATSPSLVTKKNPLGLVYNPTTGAPIMISKSETVGNVTYDDAVRGLTALGLTHQQAVTAANGFYTQGNNGRPLEGPQAAAYVTRNATNAAAQGETPAHVLDVIRQSGYVTLPDATLARLVAAAFGQEKRGSKALSGTISAPFGGPLIGANAPAAAGGV